MKAPLILVQKKDDSKKDCLKREPILRF